MSGGSAFLELTGVGKDFGTTTVLEDIDLGVEEGEILALLGPSGSGKTTLLRLIAGFESVDRGSLYLAGGDLTHVPADRRRCGMVFQHYALFPHLTVGENVAFGLAGPPRPPAAAVAARVAEVLELVDLAGYEARRIGEISGGQQQRVALARALAPRPRLLLLDEPLSNLDPSLRERTRDALRRTIEEVGITTVLVTHEQEEAFHLARRVAVLHAGRIAQVDSPERLYAAPADPFVAAFVGRASRLPGRTATGLEGPELTLLGPGAPAWPVDPEAPGATLPAGAAAELSVRPEQLDWQPEGAQDPAPPAVPGTCAGARFTGLATYLSVDLDLPGSPRVEVLAGDRPRPATGERLAIFPRPGLRLRSFPSDTSSSAGETNAGGAPLPR